MYTNGDWKITAASVRGAVHDSRNVPNQDSYSEKDFGDNRFVFALADGHGSKKCYRSERGSNIAVKAAIEVIEKRLTDLTVEDKLNARLIKSDIPKEIISVWKEAVDKDLADCPVEESETRELTAHETSIIEKNHYIVYGTTLIITLFFDGYIICWQLGDGNILFVSDQGKSSMPMGKDDTMIANETYSLCMKQADQYFNIKVFRDSDPMLRLILVSSDGYSNSFKNEAGFLKVGVDILSIIDEEGFDVIEEELEEWLTDTMSAGSGDDITAGIFFREVISSEACVTEAESIQTPEETENSEAEVESKVIEEADQGDVNPVESEWV